MVLVRYAVCNMDMADQQQQQLANYTTTSRSYSAHTLHTVFNVCAKCDMRESHRTRGVSLSEVALTR